MENLVEKTNTLAAALKETCAREHTVYRAWANADRTKFRIYISNTSTKRPMDVGHIEITEDSAIYMHKSGGLFYTFAKDVFPRVGVEVA